ncbi:MFS transporter [Rhodococcus sp. WS4]|nr:MFS transporter [Rhodococcus sp. WS4]
MVDTQDRAYLLARKTIRHQSRGGGGVVPLHRWLVQPAQDSGRPARTVTRRIRTRLLRPTRRTGDRYHRTRARRSQIEKSPEKRGNLSLTVFNYSYAVSGTARAITVEKADPEVALWAGLAAQALYMILLPIWGLLSDRWGRRPSFLITGLGLAVVAFPLANLMGPTFWQIFLPIFIALFFLGAAIAADPAYFAELFPTNVRATGVGFPYAFAISLFGGTAPLIATWLGVNDLGWVFTTYCMALALTTALVAWFSPETNGRNLRD